MQLPLLKKHCESSAHIYLTREMQRVLVHHYARFSGHPPIALLRQLVRIVTGDESAAENPRVAAMDERVLVA